jgi:hypothetical protein
MPPPVKRSRVSSFAASQSSTTTPSTTSSRPTTTLNTNTTDRPLAAFSSIARKPAPVPPVRFRIVPTPNATAAQLTKKKQMDPTQLGRKLNAALANQHTSIKHKAVTRRYVF